MGGDDIKYLVSATGESRKPVVLETVDIIPRHNEYVARVQLVLRNPEFPDAKRNCIIRYNLTRSEMETLREARNAEGPHGRIYARVRLEFFTMKDDDFLEMIGDKVNLDLFKDSGK